MADACSDFEMAVCTWQIPQNPEARTWKGMQRTREMKTGTNRSTAPHERLCSKPGLSGAGSLSWYRSVRLGQLRGDRAVPRRYRNRRIGDFLKELEITEGRSTGIPQIVRVMHRNGSPPPEFEFDDDHSRQTQKPPAARFSKVVEPVE